ncbi:MAG: SLBB domain-containing protein [Candidatus Eisenbacteria bacterium]|nr:SLBB domain-containing protein [Candidatus Eisenbacteria bacterium]
MTELVRAIEEAGVVGAGGAGFPTHVKAAARADTIIANYAECEPLVASDTAVMTAEPELVMRGLRLMQEATGAREAVVAAKAKRKEQLEIIERIARTQGGFSLHLLEDVYPAGDEHLLVEEVTGRVVPQGGIPPQVSVVVSNVTTLWRVALAADGKAFTERYVSVAGEVKNPSTLLVPIGTPVSRVLEACGGVTAEGCVFILGGPMMGEIVEDTAVPVRKSTSAVVVLPPNNPLVRKRRVSVSVAVRRAMASCMQCYDCTLLCPRHLLGHQLFPHKTMRSVAFWIEGSPDDLVCATLCSECGLCGIFVCPMDLSPVTVYQRIKQDLAARGVRPRVGREAVRPLPERHGRHVPLERLVARLGLGKYEVGAPLKERLLDVGEVRIPLGEKWGRLRPTVRVGESVKTGTVVAEPLGPGPGARAHASIDGKIEKITEESICIAA